MLLLHWPSLFDIQEVKGDAESWIDRFKDFFASDDCPTFVKAQVAKAQRYADHPQEPVFEEDEEDDAVEAEEQPDWVDVFAGRNQIYEGVERDFHYDGGEDYDWSSTRIILPEGEEPTKWLQESIKADDEQETESADLDLPQVCPLPLNENQKAIVSLVLHTLYNFVENTEYYYPLRLVVSGTAGTGKSYVIKCIQRLVRHVFEANDAIQVITPTGNAAYLVHGSTAHTFLGVPTGRRSCNELTVPTGPLLEKIQRKCEHLKVLVSDERSMFGRSTMGWMEQHARYAINKSKKNQKAIVSLVLHTLYNFVENTEYYYPLRLVVSGTAGIGKSYVIKCIQRLVRHVFEANDAIQVITPTGNAAYLVHGSTAHTFLGVPTGRRSCNELTVPTGPLLEKIQRKCEHLKVLVSDERSMFGRSTMGWMEQHARYAINKSKKNQKAIVSLVLHTLYNFVENTEYYYPLRLVVSGTAGTGKSYVIKCIQRLVRHVFEANDAIQVITPTGNAAYLVHGSTAHTFLGVPTGRRSCNELTVPTGPLLEKIQRKCEHLKVLVSDERSMFGRSTMGWMEQHARYAINKRTNADELWGGIPVAVFMGDDIQLPPVCDTPVYISDCRNVPSHHGRLVWTMFYSAVELTQIIRQNESEQQLRDVLMSLRNYTTTPQQLHWLQQFQWHNLRNVAWPRTPC